MKELSICFQEEELLSSNKQLAQHVYNVKYDALAIDGTTATQVLLKICDSTSHFVLDDLPF